MIVFVDSFETGYFAGLRKALKFCKDWQHAPLLSEEQKSALYGLEATIEHELGRNTPEELKES
jgi:hypothetical protein